MGAALAISQVLVNRIIRDNIEDSMADSAELTRNFLDVSLDRRRARTELLVNNMERASSLDPEIMRVTLATFMENWHIGLAALVLDAGGNSIAGTDTLEEMGNATGTSWFDDALTRKLAFTYVYEDDELTRLGLDSPVLAVSSPLVISGRQLSVVLFTTLSDIREAINSVSIETTGHGFLIDERGAIIAGHLFTRAAKAPGKEPDEVQAIADAVAWGRGDTSSLTIDCKGTGYLVTYTTVTQSSKTQSSKHDVKLDWAVGVIVPTDEAYAPARLVTWALLGLTAIIVFCAVFAAVLLGLSITRPINELAAAAERIGSGDLTGDVIIRTRDQIGALASVILRVRDYLRSTLSEAGYSSDKMSMLAQEQSAATQDMFSNTEEIADSVVVLARNMEAQTQKIRKIMDSMSFTPGALPPELPRLEEIRELLQESDILAEVGANKTVEIASASQDQRAAARDIAAAARRLSEMALELKEMVQRFKV
ncbi:MAG: methyl-accepting chemotaxis protein [Actinobacteria bacterium]|nr:methyl-accepting chemotaxis protein [Actinomycetota bacterium]